MINSTVCSGLFRSTTKKHQSYTKLVFCKWKKPIINRSTSFTKGQFIMTSSNGNIFRVNGHLCREFTGHRWIPRTKASNAELWCFLWSAHWINGWVNNHEAGDLRRHRAHYDVIIMYTESVLVSWRHHPLLQLMLIVFIVFIPEARGAALSPVLVGTGIPMSLILLLLGLVLVSLIG